MKFFFRKPKPKHNTAVKCVSLAAALLAASGVALADDAAKSGRDGQAFGQSLADKFQFPTEGSGGSVNLGNGESIKPSDMAPKGEGFYVSEPNVGGLQGIYDSDETMHDVGRGTQNQLWQDAQLKGNPFDPDPAVRDQPGPSTVSGAVYQIITGVSDARAQVPDLTNDPIVNTAGDHILNEGLLESFGDCSVETEVTETTRPVQVPDFEYCERVLKPAPTNCEIKHEVVVDTTIEEGGGRFTQSDGQPFLKSQFSHDKYNSSWEDHDTKGFITTSFPNSVYKQICDGVTESSISFKWTFLRGNHVRFVSIDQAPTCANGLKVRVTGQGTSTAKYYAYTMSIDARYKRVVHTVAADNWYPEECVKAAQKAAE